MADVNKFVKTLSASDSNIKIQRAKLLSDSASSAADDLVNRLKKEKNALEMKIANLTDLAPETNTSLRPGGDNFNAEKWVNELFSAKIDLKMKEIELAEAQNIVKEWFTDEQV